MGESGEGELLSNFSGERPRSVLTEVSLWDSEELLRGGGKGGGEHLVGTSDSWSSSSSVGVFLSCF